MEASEAAVIDTSAVVVYLTGTSTAVRRALRTVDRLLAPELLPAEVTQALRRLERRGEITAAVARGAVDEVAGLAAELFSFIPFRERVWALRHAVTAYDAWYVALAEALDVPLITTDQRLQRAAGLRCQVWVP